MAYRVDRTKDWPAAIEFALELLPAEHRRMAERMYGLRVPLPRAQRVRERVVKLAMDLSVSESTLYKWREEVEDTVLMVAAARGLLGADGIARPRAAARRRRA